LPSRDDFDFFARHEFVTTHVILAVTPLVVDGERDRVIRVRSRVIVETVRAGGYTTTK
jgi:hypothetical protein